MPEVRVTFYYPYYNSKTDGCKSFLTVSLIRKEMLGKEKIFAGADDIRLSLSKSGLPGKNPGRPQSIEDTYRQKTAGKRDAIAVLLSIWPAF